MSELKAFDVGLGQYCENGSPCVVAFDADQNPRLLNEKVYLKSDADKVIAELEESHKKEVSQLLILNREQANSANRLRDSMEQVIRHQKYRRCLAMARWCASRSASWCFDPADDELHKSDFYEKWKLRWRELAEKFKEAK